MKTNKYLITLGLIGCLPFSVQASNSEIDDTFMHGFEAYANELKKFGDDKLSSHAIESYTTDIKSAQKKLAILVQMFTCLNLLKLLTGSIQLSEVLSGTTRQITA